MNDKYDVVIDQCDSCGRYFMNYAHACQFDDPAPRELDEDDYFPQFEE